MQTLKKVLAHLEAELGQAAQEQVHRRLGLAVLGGAD
jgi:hypothetical protein